VSGVDAVAAVVSKLSAVAGIGNVYNMLGNPLSEASFKARYSATENGVTKILAWEVTREGSKGVDEEAQAMARTEHVVIYGYMSIFQALVDAICEAFDPYSGRHLDGYDWSGPLDVDGPKFARLGNVMVHYVRMGYPVRQFPISG
jgi:hypothetical protein